MNELNENNTYNTYMYKWKKIYTQESKTNKIKNKHYKLYKIFAWEGKLESMFPEIIADSETW
jgi:hypothetical protein